jgi:hypothetical protein
MRWEATSRCTRIWVLGSFSGRAGGEGRVRSGWVGDRDVADALVRARVGRVAREGRRALAVAEDVRAREQARRRIAGRIMAYGPHGAR